MPKYFFHVRDHEEFSEDTLGVELPDDDVAMQEAAIAAREMCAEKLKAGEKIDGQIFHVMSETGAVIGTVPFRSVVEL
ncbi:DUF6894 family protein [Pararhizobium arenae]|uniref:DUF6894 family protein n=1 Tax=Pararhizobium arenae TaxID=1856850 RepID=UPI00094AA1FD|nr:hypothetical protein [Pararhizobium arenae]